MLKLPYGCRLRSAFVIWDITCDRSRLRSAGGLASSCARVTTCELLCLLAPADAGEERCPLGGRERQHGAGPVLGVTDGHLVADEGDLDAAVALGECALPPDRRDAFYGSHPQSRRGGWQA